MVIFHSYVSLPEGIWYIPPGFFTWFFFQVVKISTFKLWGHNWTPWLKSPSRHDPTNEKWPLVPPSATAGTGLEPKDDEKNQLPSLPSNTAIPLKELRIFLAQHIWWFLLLRCTKYYINPVNWDQVRWVAAIFTALTSSVSASTRVKLGCPMESGQLDSLFHKMRE